MKSLPKRCDPTLLKLRPFSKTLEHCYNFYIFAAEKNKPRLLIKLALSDPAQKLINSSTGIVLE